MSNHSIPKFQERRKVGIVGFGHIGQYIYRELKNNDYGLDVAFVWNRSVDKLSGLQENEILHDLNQFFERNVDLIIEVAHISITEQFGAKFLSKCDFMVGSPTALANKDLEAQLYSAANNNGLYVPAGAFWGAEDIQKMASQGSLKALKVTMKKHPSSLKLNGELAEMVKNMSGETLVLYDGPVRDLCPLAPSNVNTMACAAIAASNLGFDKVQGCLVADKRLACHIIEIDVVGPSNNNGDCFTVRTVRTNPSQSGAVTGNETYASFLQSVKRARCKGPGVHLC
uniref:Aspartate dehydrogenase domain-containing protein n=1 Tax=Hydra vulgaris TaxID=6087 RepID=T2MK18_HYDVU